MGKFTQDTLSFYHTFSKTQVNNTAPYSSLGNSINKSGHTVQASDVWADDIPFFAEKGTTGEVHSIFSAHAQTNDLVKVGSKIYQRNATPYTSGATFETLWSEKTKSIMDWSIVDGKYQYTEVDGALVDGSYLVNAAGKPVIKYYERAQLSILTAANNANVTSSKLASRLKVGGTWGTDSKENVPFMNGGRWVEQFVTVTDKYVNGEAATIYAPQVYLTSTAAAPQVAGTVYFDFCATGVILWDSRTADGKEVITCFEYVGDKLSNALTNISSEIEDIVSTTMEGVVASVGTTDAASTAGLSIKGTKTAPTVDITTGTVTAGEAKLVTGGAVATVTDALSSRIAQLEGITHFSVVVVPDGQTIENVTPLVENTIYLVKDAKAAEGTYIEYIAYKPAGSESVVTEKIGSTAIDLSGYTTDAEHEALQGRVSTAEGQIATITSTDTTKEGSIAKALADAKTYAEGQASAAKSGAETTAANALSAARTEITAEIAQAKSEAIASAEVTITAGTGIVVTGEGKGTTFQIAVSDDVATAASVSALSQVVASNKTELEGKITAAQTAASTALETAKTEIKGTTDALDTRLQTAEGKVSTLEGQVDALTTGDNSVAKQIETAVSGLETKLTTGEGSLGTRVSTLEGSVKTINETTIPNAITTAQNGAVTTVKALTLSASDSDDAAKVTVTLGGTVQTPTITVTSSDIASAQSLTALETKVNNFHKAGVSYVVADTLPTIASGTESTYNGKVYLVNTGLNGVVAADGSRIEYMYVNKGSEESPAWDWEQIGTTKTDLSGYATNATIEAMDADLTVNGISVKQVNGTVTELSEALITASVPANTTSVVGNVAYVGSTKHVIAPEKFQTAAQMPSTLTSWVADLSNLTVGDNMFKGCTGLTVFVGDLSSLTSGVDMFNGCALDDESLEILAENLPTVTSGTIDIGGLGVGANHIKIWETIRQKGWTVLCNGKSYDPTGGGGSVD